MQRQAGDAPPVSVRILARGDSESGLPRKRTSAGSEARPGVRSLSQMSTWRQVSSFMVLCTSMTLGMSASVTSSPLPFRCSAL